MSLTQRDFKKLSINTSNLLSSPHNRGIIPISASQNVSPSYSSRAILTSNIKHLKIKSFDKANPQPTTANSTLYSRIYSKEAEVERIESTKVNYASLPRINLVTENPFSSKVRSPNASLCAKEIQEQIRKVRQTRIKFSNPFSLECLTLAVPNIVFDENDFVADTFAKLKSEVPNAFEGSQNQQSLATYLVWLKRKQKDLQSISSLKLRDFYKLAFCRLHYQLSSLDNLLAEEASIIFHEVLGLFEKNKAENEATREDFSRKSEALLQKANKSFDDKLRDKDLLVEELKLKLEFATKSMRALAEETFQYKSIDQGLRRQIEKYKSIAGQYQVKASIFKQRYHKVVQKNLSMKLNQAQKAELRAIDQAAMKKNHSFYIEDEAPLLQKNQTTVKLPAQQKFAGKRTDTLDLPSQSSQEELLGYKEGVEAFNENLERLDQMAIQLNLVPNGRTFICHQATQTETLREDNCTQTKISCVDKKYDRILVDQETLDSNLREHDVRVMVQNDPVVKIALRIPDKVLRKKASNAAERPESPTRSPQNRVSPRASQGNKGGFAMRLERSISPTKGQPQTSQGTRL